MQYTFKVGQEYKREQVSQQVGDDGYIGGNWATGYPQKNGVTFVFSNVGNPGQTGHDYDNYFDGPDLVWRGRTDSHKNHPSIQRMTMASSEVHVFWRTGGRDPFKYAGLGNAIDITDEVPVRIRWRLSDPSIRPPGRTPRLPISELNKIRPEHIYESVELLKLGYADHPFAHSTDYDVLTEEGHRLPPKAVFGIAATLALGFQVGPHHFTAGISSPCFRLIQEAGYRIITKNAPSPSVQLPGVDHEFWMEGGQKLVTHKKRERSDAASKAKKSKFKAEHGKLFCEKCHLDPVTLFGTELAEACIEVHHKDVQIQDMDDNHVTTLDSLQCLCANCHRLEHAILRKRYGMESNLKQPQTFPS